MRFGEFRLLVRERRLERGGVAVALGGRAMDILTELARRAGEVVSKAELSQAAWPGMIVEEGSLRFHIASLRRALSGSGAGEGILKTIAGRGYCFTAAIVEEVVPGGCAMAPADQPLVPWPSRPPIGIEDSAGDAGAALLACRFLTLVGAPGIGKTTLALDMARRLGGRFPGGIAFVDLGAVSEAGQVPQAIARALEPAHALSGGAEGLVTLLGGRAMLLILDGCEHLIDAVAQVAEHLARHLPSLALLATSRESLRVEGEHVFGMAPLACPPEGSALTAQEALAFPAIELFVDRMRAGAVGYDLRDEDVGVVAGLCRQLDGIPLALQLAAGQVAICGLAQTAALMHSPTRLLWQGWRTAAPRHRTLKATLDWSHNLLTQDEQRVFRRLGVFVGGFSLTEAQAIAADEHLAQDRVAQIMTDLVARSLVVGEGQGAQPFYRLHDMTRAYALARLGDCGEAETILHRHPQPTMDTRSQLAAIHGFWRVFADASGADNRAERRGLVPKLAC